MNPKLDLWAFALFVVLLAPRSVPTTARLVLVVLVTLAGETFLGTHHAVDATGRTRMTTSCPVPPRVGVTHTRFSPRFR